MGKIKVLAILLLLCSTVTAGTYKKDIQLMASGVGVDSVVAIVEVDNTEIDSLLWKSFPVDSFMTLPDTAILNIAWFWFFSDNSGEATKYTTAYEQIPQTNKTESSFNSVIGVYAVDTSGTDDSIPQVTFTLKDAGGTPRKNIITGSDGFATARLSNGNWTIIGSLNGYVLIDTTINVTGDDTLSIKGYDVSIPNPPTSTTATAFGDIRNLAGALVANVTVIATRPRDARNTCDSTWTLPADVIEYTNSSGRFTMTLVKSNCFGNQAYTFTAYKSIGGILQRLKERDVVIPSDSTTIRIW